MKAATSDTASMIAAAAVNARGDDGLMSNSSDETKRLPPIAAGIPIATPAPTRISDQGHGRRAPHHPEAVAQILNDSVDSGEAPHVA